MDVIVFTQGNQTIDYVCKDEYLNQIPADREDTVCSSSKTVGTKAISAGVLPRYCIIHI